MQFNDYYCQTRVARHKSKPKTPFPTYFPLLLQTLLGCCCKPIMLCLCLLHGQSPPMLCAGSLPRDAILPELVLHGLLQAVICSTALRRGFLSRGLNLQERTAPTQPSLPTKAHRPSGPILWGFPWAASCTLSGRHLLQHCGLLHDRTWRRARRRARMLRAHGPRLFCPLGLLLPEHLLRCSRAFRAVSLRCSLLFPSCCGTAFSSSLVCCARSRPASITAQLWRLSPLGAAGVALLCNGQCWTLLISVVPL